MQARLERTARPVAVVSDTRATMYQNPSGPVPVPTLAACHCVGRAWYNSCLAMPYRLLPSPADLSMDAALIVLRTGAVESLHWCHCCFACCPLHALISAASTSHAGRQAGRQAGIANLARQLHARSAIPSRHTEWPAAAWPDSAFGAAYLAE